MIFIPFIPNKNNQKLINIIVLFKFERSLDNNTKTRQKRKGKKGRERNEQKRKKRKNGISKKENN